MLVAEDTPVNREVARVMLRKLGYEVTRRIRDPASQVLDRNIPPIAMTTHVLQGERKKCLQAGMDAYLAKPIRRETLDAMLRPWLQKTGDSLARAQRAESEQHSPK